MELKGKRMLSENPQLMADWDWEKNQGISPLELSHGCNQRVWWRCQKGHSWQAVVNNRSNGTGCPKCAKSRIRAGINDLKTKSPELSRQWNYGRNGELQPDDVTEWSRQKVWWKCVKGHEWEATVFARRSGGGCHYCTGQLPIKGQTDFQTVHPDLALEWDCRRNGTLKPDAVSYGSNRSVWWIGTECRHSYQTAVSNRHRGSGCPVCAGKKVVEGINDLATLSPDLALDWDYEKNILKPSEVTRKNQRKIWWRCRKNHSWEATIANRTRGDGCPYCGGVRAMPGETDLATLRPDLAREWDHKKNGKEKPEHFMSGSGKKVWWICKEGHSWEATILNRSRGDNCPYCSGKYIISGINDLGTIKPDIAAEWNYSRNGNIRPENILPYSNQSYWWQCQSGHEWKAVVSNRSKGNGCPYCSGRRLLKGINDLATVNPELAAEWDPEKNGDLTPADIMSTVSRKVWWKCSSGHCWKSTVASRKGGTGCPYCSGLFPVSGESDLLTVNPTLASEWDYEKNAIEIMEIAVNSNKKEFIRKILFTSESVTEGHPDKICDQIADAILDAILRKKPSARVACEVFTTTGVVIVMGEVSAGSLDGIDVEQIVRNTVREIGYQIPFLCKSNFFKYIQNKNSLVKIHLSLIND